MVGSWAPKLVAGAVAASAAAVLLLHAGHPASQKFATPKPRSAHLQHAAWQQSAAGAPLSAADTDDLYQEKCALCHAPDRTGKPPAFPTLVGVAAKYSEAEITGQIRHGKGRMPAFPSLTDEEVKALVKYVRTPALPEKSAPAEGTPQPATPAIAAATVLLVAR